MHKNIVVVTAVFGLLAILVFVLLKTTQTTTASIPAARTVTRPPVPTIGLTPGPTIIPSFTPITTPAERPLSVGSPTSSAKAIVIKANYSVQFGLVPNEFTVKAGLPYRLEIAARDDGEGCMASILISGLAEDVQVFEKGQTHVFNFTAPKAGTYDIICAMGIPHGYINAK